MALLQMESLGRSPAYDRRSIESNSAADTMRCLAAIVIVLVSHATLAAQPSGDLAGATDRFMALERNLSELPQWEYSATREKLAEQALALARTSPNSRDAESLLHWILRSQRASPTVQAAVECLLKHHRQAEATLRRLPYYAEQPTGWTSQLFAGLVNADLGDEHRWFVATYNALHEQSMLLMTDRIRLGGEDRAQVESMLGAELATQLAEREVEQSELRVIDVFTKLAAQHGEHRIGDFTVKEIAAGAIFAVRHLRHGKTAGELSGKSTDGMQVSLKDHRGKVVLIDFWNTDCPPSLCAMPVLKDTQEQLGKSQFILFGVSGDREQAKLERSMQDLEIDWPIIVDADRALQQRWQAIHLPYYCVLDANHVVRYRGDDYRKAILVASSLVDKAQDRDRSK